METKPAAPPLSEADRAALTKFAQIQFRAHAAGCATRELTEFRNDLRRELQQYQRDFERQQEQVAQVNPRSHIANRVADGVHGTAGLPQSDLSDVVNRELELADRQLARTKVEGERKVALLTLRLQLVEEELAKAEALSRPLFANRDALHQHLTKNGTLRYTDGW